MSDLVGKIRILPPDTPGLPPSVPFDQEQQRYDLDLVCFTGMWAVDQPILYEIGMGLMEGVYCTRPKDHPEEEIHVCHLRNEQTDELVHIIVWGGE